MLKGVHELYKKNSISKFPQLHQLVILGDDSTVPEVTRLKVNQYAKLTHSAHADHSLNTVSFMSCIWSFSCVFLSSDNSRKLHLRMGSREKPRENSILADVFKDVEWRFIADYLIVFLNAYTRKGSLNHDAMLLIVIHLLKKGNQKKI